MKKIEDILSQQIFPAARKLRPENVVVGQKDHPARLEIAWQPPDYVGRFPGRHAMPEFCVCLSGRCVIRIDGASYLLTADDFCFVGRNRRHFESYQATQQAYEILWCLPYSLEYFFFLHCRYMNRDYRKLQSLHVRTPSDVVGCMDAIIEQELPWPQLRQAIGRLMTEIKNTLRSSRVKKRHGLMEQEQRKYHSSMAEHAKQFIREHYAEKLSLEQVANVVRLNPRYFEKVFHETVGMTFLKQLNLTRLEQAHRLLNESTLNVSEIAGACGFSDYSTFSRLFKKNYGLSPRQFRNRYTPIHG